MWATGSEDLPPATWLAIADGQPVGMVAASLRADHCEIGALWVDSDWRGRAVARALMEAAELRAHKVKATWCSLSVADDNDDAHRLYLSPHYAPTGSFKVARNGRREIYMRKRAGL